MSKSIIQGHYSQYKNFKSNFMIVFISFTRNALKQCSQQFTLCTGKLVYQLLNTSFKKIKIRDLTTDCNVEHRTQTKFNSDSSRIVNWIIHLYCV